MEKIEAADIRVQDIDHCGIIAGICAKTLTNSIMLATANYTH
jgi:hypothetical protein